MRKSNISLKKNMTREKEEGKDNLWLEMSQGGNHFHEGKKLPLKSPLAKGWRW